MSTSAAAPQPQNLESRKLQLLVRIAQIDDERMIDLLEDIVSEDAENHAILTEEEVAIVEERLADFKRKPNDNSSLSAKHNF